MGIKEASRINPGDYISKKGIDNFAGRLAKEV